MLPSHVFNDRQVSCIMDILAPGTLTGVAGLGLLILLIPRVAGVSISMVV